jgi:hypothetical protein
VKPFLKGHKNDYRDAEAIAEAVQRPTMHFVAIKTPEQMDLLALHWVRSRLVSQRTGVINQIRGFLIERGIPVRQGVVPLRKALPDILSSNTDALSPRIVNLIAIRGLSGSDYPGFDEAPERDEQLACQGHNGDPSRAPSQSTDALAEPFCQLAAGLVAKPEPCELDHGRPCTRVPSPANAPIAVHTTALVGHRRDADVAGDLSAVAE